LLKSLITAKLRKGKKGKKVPPPLHPPNKLNMGQEKGTSGKSKHDLIGKREKGDAKAINMAKVLRLTRSQNPKNVRKGNLF